MSQNYKETLNLPRTDFPMKANGAAHREAESFANGAGNRAVETRILLTQMSLAVEFSRLND